MGLLTLLSGLVSPVAKAYQANQSRKQAKESGLNKIALNKQAGEQQHQLNQDEWEAIGKRSENETWKDEYITIVITSPFVLLFAASVVSAFTGDMRYIDAVNAGILNLTNLGVDLGKLMYVVVLAAVGIKATKIFK
jgi:hypothetical protein